LIKLGHLQLISDLRCGKCSSPFADNSPAADPSSVRRLSPIYLRAQDEATAHPTFVVRDREHGIGCPARCRPRSAAILCLMYPPRYASTATAHLAGRAFPVTISFAIDGYDGDSNGTATALRSSGIRRWIWVPRLQSGSSSLKVRLIDAGRRHSLQQSLQLRIRARGDGRACSAWSAGLPEPYGRPELESISGLGRPTGWWHGGRLVPRPRSLITQPAVEEELSALDSPASAPQRRRPGAIRCCASGVRPCPSGACFEHRFSTAPWSRCFHLWRCQESCAGRACAASFPCPQPPSTSAKGWLMLKQRLPSTISSA